MSDRREVPCVGAVVFDAAGRLLLIQRGNPPAQGQWSLPGGRVEPGEDGPQAVVRELREETSLRGRITEMVGEVRRDAPDGSIYVIEDFLLEVDGAPEPSAGDDAMDARWFTIDEVRSLDTSAGLVEALEEWKLL